MPTTTIQFFKFTHLPEGPLRDVSRLFSTVASRLEAEVPDGPEKSAGMRKLLEAKDCFVRAALDGRAERPAVLIDWHHPCRFKIGEVIEHARTKQLYVIAHTPHNTILPETRERAYGYHPYMMTTSAMVVQYVRTQANMEEEGRFKSVKLPNPYLTGDLEAIRQNEQTYAAQQFNRSIEP